MERFVKKLFLISMISIASLSFASDRTLRIVGKSMMPNFQDGQHLEVVDFDLEDRKELVRGKVIIAEIKKPEYYKENLISLAANFFVERDTILIIKRVVGIPGDTVITYKDEVWINPTDRPSFKYNQGRFYSKKKRWKYDDQDGLFELIGGVYEPVEIVRFFVDTSRLNEAAQYLDEPWTFAPDIFIGAGKLEEPYIVSKKESKEAKDDEEKQTNQLNEEEQKKKRRIELMRLKQYTKSFKVKDGQYLILSDNRLANTYDGRDFGTIKLEQIRYLPKTQ